MFLKHFVSKNQLACSSIRGVLVENRLNYLFHVCFFFKKILLDVLVLVGDLLMEWSHAILNMCDKNLLIDTIVC